MDFRHGHRFGVVQVPPGEAAAVVLESTVFAVAYIPLVFWLAGV